MRNLHSRNKGLWGGLLLLALLIPLYGCSPSAKSEKEIIADLQQSSAFISEAVKIDSCEIIKRQTNNDSKSDLVYLTVYVNEDELTCALSYFMEYTLYNDGWILENVSRYDDGPWSIDGLPIKRISSDITNRDSYFNDYALEVTNCEIVGTGNSYDGKRYEKRFDVRLTASCSIFDYEATYSPIWPDGKKHARNVYAHSEAECEKLLAEMITKMKAEIAAEKERLKATQKAG